MSQPSSQESALDAVEFNELQNSVQPETTKQQTSWGVNVFEVWCKKRHVNIDLATVSSVELSDILRRFYAEVKTGPLAYRWPIAGLSTIYTNHSVRANTI